MNRKSPWATPFFASVVNSEADRTRVLADERFEAGLVDGDLVVLGASILAASTSTQMT